MKWHWKTISQFCHTFKKIVSQNYFLVCYFLFVSLLWDEMTPCNYLLICILSVHQCSFICLWRRLNIPKRRPKYEISFLAGVCQEVFSIKYIQFSSLKHYEQMMEWCWRYTGLHYTHTNLQSKDFPVGGPLIWTRTRVHWCRWKFIWRSKFSVCFCMISQPWWRFGRWGETWRRIWSP